MLEPYFRKEDFALCDVPVPKGYPQSQTHAGIGVHNGKFCLTCSPYPLIKHGKFSLYTHLIIQKLTGGRLGKFLDADSYENPLLYEGISDENGIPTKFKLIEPAPLMEKPVRDPGVQAYNSDPDIFIEGDHIYILNREYRRKRNSRGIIEQYTKVYLIEGTLASDISFKRPVVFMESMDPMLSPCLTRFRDQYVYAFINSNSAIDGTSFGGIYISTADSIEALRSNTNFRKVELKSDNMLPWHMSLFVYENKLYCIMACVERGNKSRIWQMLGVFDETLSHITIFKQPLTDYNSYRGSACVLTNGTFVLYTTTVHEKVKASQSVDGRDIIMAYDKFDTIIEKIKK